MKNRNDRQLRLPWLAFLLSAAVLVCLRIILKLDFIDPATGFYEGGRGFIFAYRAAYVGLMGLLLFTAYGDAQPAENDRPCREMPFSALGAALFGTALALRTALTLLKLPGAVHSKEKIQAMNALVGVSTVLISAVAAGTLFWLALHLLTGTLKACKDSPLLLSLILSQCFWLIERFTSRIAPVAVSDAMLEILLLSFGILFFIAHARALTGMNAEKSDALLQFSGYACTLTGLSLVVPEALGLLLGRAVYHPAELSGFLCEAALTLYCVLFTQGLCAQK